MPLFFIILFIVVLFFYLYFRLPEGNLIRDWLDRNAMKVGHVFIALWIGFLFYKDPKIAVFYGVPLIGLSIFMIRKKKNFKDPDD